MKLVHILFTCLLTHSYSTQLAEFCQQENLISQSYALLRIYNYHLLECQHLQVGNEVETMKLNQTSENYLKEIYRMWDNE